MFQNTHFSFKTQYAVSNYITGALTLVQCTCSIMRTAGQSDFSLFLSFGSYIIRSYDNGVDILAVYLVNMYFKAVCKQIYDVFCNSPSTNVKRVLVIQKIGQLRNMKGGKVLFIQKQNQNSMVDFHGTLFTLHCHTLQVVSQLRSCL